MATQPKLSPVDPMWERIRDEAEAVSRDEPLMAALVHSGILYHHSLEAVLGFRLAQKLAADGMPEMILREIFDDLYAKNPDLINSHDADSLERLELLMELEEALEIV